MKEIYCFGAKPGPIFDSKLGIYHHGPDKPWSSVCSDSLQEIYNLRKDYVHRGFEVTSIDEGTYYDSKTKPKGVLKIV